MPVGITAVGHYVPEKVLSNQDLQQFFETSDEWIISRTGIKTRRIAAEGEYSSHLGIKAVQNLQSRYPEALNGVDLVIVATATPDARFPSTAALIADACGLGPVGAFDLSAACAGFGYAVSVAHGMLVSGSHRKALVIGAETLSKITDWSDRTTAILFGDAAGAVILDTVPEDYGFKSFVMGSDGSGATALYAKGLADTLQGVPLVSDCIVQNGREVFKFAVRVMDTVTIETLNKAGLTPQDLDFLVPHQANMRIIESACQRLGLTSEQVEVNLDRYGNTSAASIPLALSEAVLENRIQDGQHVLLIGFGGGLSWASALLKWWQP